MKRVKELEEQLEQQPPDRPMPHRVRGILKEIVRHPERAKDLAQEALRFL